MVTILKLTNPDTKETIEVNERLILDTLSIIKSRKPLLYRVWINKLERLYKKKITDEHFKY